MYQVGERYIPYENTCNDQICLKIIPGESTLPRLFLSSVRSRGSQQVTNLFSQAKVSNMRPEHILFMSFNHISYTENIIQRFKPIYSISCIFTPKPTAPSCLLQICSQSFLMPNRSPQTEEDLCRSCSCNCCSSLGLENNQVSYSV